MYGFVGRRNSGHEIAIQKGQIRVNITARFLPLQFFASNGILDSL
jgi:hypothetical protein